MCVCVCLGQKKVAPLQWTTVDFFRFLCTIFDANYETAPDNPRQIKKKVINVLYKDKFKSL